MDNVGPTGIVSTKTTTQKIVPTRLLVIKMEPPEATPWVVHRSIRLGLLGWNDMKGNKK